MLTPHTAFSDSKPHYELLDGLRGVAALLVVWYHLFEAFATSPVDQRFNHGYLAVDFFFLLSGFVIGYAYDERWGRGRRMRDFIKRRLIRLHPMVVLGALLGAAAFFVQGSVRWNGEPVSTGMVLARGLGDVYKRQAGKRALERRAGLDRHGACGTALRPAAHPRMARRRARGARQRRDVSAQRPRLVALL